MWRQSGRKSGDGNKALLYNYSVPDTKLGTIMALRLALENILPRQETERFHDFPNI